MLMSVDDMVGRLFGTLRRLGKRGEHSRSSSPTTATSGQSTASAGTAPQGAEARPVHAVRSRFRSSFAGRGTSRPGTEDGRITGTVDIAPTVLDAAGIAPDPAKPPLDGHSLLSARGGRASCSSTGASRGFRPGPRSVRGGTSTSSTTRGVETSSSASTTTSRGPRSVRPLSGPLLLGLYDRVVGVVVVRGARW